MGAPGACRAGCEGGQRGVFDFDEPQGVEGGGFVVGHDDRDGFAVITNFTARQRRLVAHVESDQDVGPIGAGEDPAHAGGSRGGGGFDLLDFRVGEGAKEHGGLQRSGADQVVGVAERAADLGRRIGAKRRGAQMGRGVHARQSKPVFWRMQKTGSKRNWKPTTDEHGSTRMGNSQLRIERIQRMGIGGGA
jgi:hypothetical protein